MFLSLYRISGTLSTEDNLRRVSVILGESVESGWSVGGEASTASVKSFDKASK